MCDPFRKAQQFPTDAAITLVSKYIYRSAKNSPSYVGHVIITPAGKKKGEKGKSRPTASYEALFVPRSVLSTFVIKALGLGATKNSALAN